MQSFIQVSYLLEVGLTEELSEHEYHRIRYYLFDYGLKSLGLLALGKCEELLNL